METLNSGKKPYVKECSGYPSVLLLLCMLSVVPFDTSAANLGIEYRTFAGTYGLSDQKFSDSPIDSYINTVNGTNSGFAHGWVSNDGALFAESSALASEGGNSSPFYAGEVYLETRNPYLSYGETLIVSFDWSYELELYNLGSSSLSYGPFVNMRGNIYDETARESLLDFNQSVWLDETGVLSDSGSVFASFELIAGHEYDIYFTIDAYSEFSGYTEPTSANAYGEFTDLQIITASLVPVPAALWLFGSGLLCMASVARRSKKDDREI